MLLVNGYNKIINHLRWKYFMDDFKPHEKEMLEKVYKTLPDNQKNEVREFRILLDVIHDDETLKADLGVNAYELYPIGLNCFINFKDKSNPEMFKVHDFTKSSTLFEDSKAKGFTKEQIRKSLDELLVNDKNYIKNFAKGYIILALPEGINDKTLGINKDAETLEFKSVKFDDKNKALIIKVN